MKTVAGFALNTLVATLAGFSGSLLTGAVLTLAHLVTPETAVIGVLIATPFAAAGFGRLSK